jgi:hypothetical protein
MAAGEPSPKKFKYRIIKDNIKGRYELQERKFLLGWTTIAINVFLNQIEDIAAIMRLNKNRHTIIREFDLEEN